jgi:hypothetical protein
MDNFSFSSGHVMGQSGCCGRVVVVAVAHGLCSSDFGAVAAVVMNFHNVNVVDYTLD